MTRTGYVFLCDIVGFSERPPKEQARAVRYLSGWIMRQLEAQRWNARQKPYLNSVGDGFLLAFFEDSIKDGDGAEWCLQLARDLISYCRRYKPNPEIPLKHQRLAIRIALHKGSFNAPTKSFGGKHACGMALNWSARLIGVADASNIIVSEDFRRPLAEEAFGDSWRTEPFPRFKPDTGGIYVPVKHDRDAIVFQYLGDDNPDVKTDPPTKIEHQDEIHDLIRAELRALAQLLETLGPVTTLKPRLSIFVPDRDLEKLRVTRYRYRPDGKQIYPSYTRYNIRGDVDEAQGPAGIAYVTKRPEIVTGLPEPYPDHDAYVAAIEGATTMNGHPLNLDRGFLNTDRQWGRSAQAFIAVPVKLGEFDAGGVLCIDTRDNLATHNETDLNQMANELHSRCCRYLAALLMARRGGG